MKPEKPKEVFKADIKADLSAEEVEENDKEKEVSHEVHGERFDEPVRGPCDSQPFGLFHRSGNAGKVDLHHHRIDHDPDEDGHRNGNIGILPFGDRIREYREPFPDGQTDDDAQENPNGEIFFEEAKGAFCFFSQNIFLQRGCFITEHQNIFNHRKI